MSKQTKGQPLVVTNEQVREARKRVNKLRLRFCELTGWDDWERLMAKLEAEKRRDDR